MTGTIPSSHFSLEFSPLGLLPPVFFLSQLGIFFTAFPRPRSFPLLFFPRRYFTRPFPRQGNQVKVFSRRLKLVWFDLVWFALVYLRLVWFGWVRLKLV